jgi:hypothetical protein
VKKRRAWILECDELFNLANIPAAHRARWGIAHVRGHAKTWLKSSTIDLNSVSWDTLCQTLIERFPDTVSTDPMDQLHELYQVNSVNNYIDVFEHWMTSMKRGRSYLPADFLLRDSSVGSKKASITMSFAKNQVHSCLLTCTQGNMRSPS